MLPPPSSSKAPPLDYLHPSPVRGQLEPADTKTPKGWRYIQTTDTLNQFKVLLPPGTASMYEQLLKFEDYELRKGSALSWNRILEIRHLKNRMIRKCQKLAKASASATPGMQTNHSFRSIVAPSDFRIKEMEKWFLEQHKRTLVKQKRNDNSVQTCKCPKCSSSNAQAVPGRHSNPSAGNQLYQHRPIKKAVDDNLDGRSRYPSQNTLAHLRSQRSITLPLQHNSGAASAHLALPPQSPPPLPHLLRIRAETGYDLSADPQKIVAPHDEPPVEENPTPRSEEEIKPAVMTSIMKKAIPRPPSCIKRSSMGDLTKRVSWADDQDVEAQVTRYVSASTDSKWEEIRVTYLEQVSGLETLHQQVQESLEHLRIESEHLKHADETIKLQRDMLDLAFQDIEKKQLSFQAKVQEALHDGKRAVSLINSSTQAHSNEHQSMM